MLRPLVILTATARHDVLLRHTDGRWDYYPMDGRNPVADQRGLAGDVLSAP
jgi:hypothetical protein